MPKPTDHDTYIGAAAEFAAPILERIRSAVHEACPDVEETMRWSTPHFDHGGILVGMAAFKKHVNLVFWRGKDMADPKGILEVVGKTGMGSARIETLKDLPAKRVLVQYVKEAVRLNEEVQDKPKKKAAKKATKETATKGAPKAPADLLAAMKKSKKALTIFEGFSNTNKKEYVDWVVEAKREATREKRIAQAIEWMAEGKPRNWKYMKEWR